MLLWYTCDKHTVYWQYHLSVAALPIVPMALVAMRQQTRDICQYTVCNLYFILMCFSLDIESEVLTQQLPRACVAHEPVVIAITCVNV